MASIEVQRFLMGQGGTNSGARASFGVPAQRSGVGITPRVSDAQVRRARIAVAGGSLGEEDCAQLLKMLGLAPDEEGVAPVQR